MRKLLLFFAMLCVSIGAWAGPAEGFEMKKDDIGRWFAQTDASLTPEKVIYIEVTDQAGALKAALDELTLILGGSTDKPHYAEYRTALDAASDDATNFIADNRLIVKIVYTGNNGSLTLSNDDIAALNAVTVPTIDLQDLKPASVFTLSNSNVKNLILPDEWTMAQVQAAATGCSNLNAALSIGTDVGAGEHADGTPVTGIGKSFVAYVNKPGTLYQCTRRLGYLDHNNDKVGSVNPYTWALSNVKLLTIAGTPSARDFNGTAANGAVKFDPDGHLVFDREADETSTDKDAGIGGTRVLLGDNMSGALTGANLVKLDLGNAIITDAHCSDLTISWSYSCVATSLKEVIFPTTPLLKTLPADCLNGDYSLLEEVCIPGNIEVLKTRACYISTNIMRHIWTTGTTEHMVYDNGAYLVPDAGEDPVVDHTGHAPLDDTVWNAGNSPEQSPRYGTITLPENLKLIESHNFTARSVSDVYVLAKTAPECHVDAFSTIMYLGNNTIDTQYIVEQGMVTRQAYAQSVAKGEYIAFLHYPRECGTPDIQRYTDPTREYSVATTLRDGKGNVIYFPNQSELNRAYLQGTTGYVWYAWDSERIPDNGDNGDANSFKNCNPGTLTSHTTAAQQQANGFYTANTMTDPDKTDRSFYDVRLDSNEEPTLAQPSGLKWYYNTIWEGQQLYPEAETVGVTDDLGQPVMETVPVYDANGKIVYDELPLGSSYEGNYYKYETDEYVVAEDGNLYRPMLNRNYDGSKPKPWYKQESKQIADKNGDYIWTNTIGNQYNYALVSDWLTWGHTEEELAQKRASGWTFRIEKSYVADDNGEYYLGDYTTYSGGETDFVSGLSGPFRKETVYAYRPAESSDPEPYYQMQTQQVQKQQVIKGYDYRGWHQFVLTAYATNDDRPLTPVKFYQTDNDWWTVCFPYDLSYNDMKMFFGNKDTGAIPYLSKLRYVVRDYDKEKITLMFSKNLMVYKENITNPSTTDDYVHGVIDDETKWSESELEDDPIILHKGVPYLIKPNIDVNASRQFDVFQTETPELYKRLIDAQNVDGGTLETYIYKGEYTVPAYVIGNNAPEATVESRSFQHAPLPNSEGMSGGPKFTYNSSDKITYGGEKVSAKISSDFSYTFVGSFFLSVMPQYCYFLGWDSNKNCAAFWFNRVTNPSSYDWNNQTGVICPNFNTGLLINPATSLSDPAKWSVSASDIKNDDLVGVASGAKKSLMDMDFGSIDVVVSGIGKINADNIMNGAKNADVIYDMQGVRMNRPLNRLPKGVYIVNGKKYVVD